MAEIIKFLDCYFKIKLNSVLVSNYFHIQLVIDKLHCQPQGLSYHID